MAVQLKIPYETLVDLVEQLSEADQQDLIRHLRQRHAPRELTAEQKIEMMNAAVIDREVNEEPSPRREDWYD